MLSYRLKCRKNIENKSSEVAKINNKRIMLLSKYSVCDSKKLKFLKEQKDRGLLSSLGIKTLLIKVPLLGPLLF